MAGHIRYYIEDNSVRERLLRALKRSFRLLPADVSSCEQHFFDTFDWRLYRSGLLLFCQNKYLRLVRMKDGVLLEKIYWSGNTAGNFFAASLKDCPLKDRIAELCGSRAILPLAGIKAESRLYTLSDESGNAAAVLKFEDTYYLDQHGAGEPFYCSLDLSSLSGFKDSALSIDRTVRRMGAVDVEAGRNDLWHVLLGMLGRAPDDYSGRISMEMDPSQNVSSAVAGIIVRMIGTMEENRDGIINDIDSEFLHDFRVALRRMKSASSMLKGLIPKKTLDRFNRDFASLRLITNELRDMDVYLQMQSEYLDLLPGSLSEGLESFFSAIRSRREAEASELSAYLRHRKSVSTLEKWKNFFASLSSESASISDAQSLIDSASKSVSVHFKKLLKASGKLSSSSPDQDFHRIRIRCKKLRYCLEFFGPLFPEDSISSVLRKLKALQDCLGRLNDCSVHSSLTVSMLEKMNHSSPGWVQSAAAAGGLITGLASEKERLKADAVRALDKLTRKKQRKLFQKTFKVQELSSELSLSSSEAHS